jgi:hypothetical protein
VLVKRALFLLNAALAIEILHLVMETTAKKILTPTPKEIMAFYYVDFHETHITISKFLWGSPNPNWTHV